MVQPENAHSNLFKAGNYSQIAYRLFVSMSPSPDRLTLSKAEWTIRKTTPNALVYLRAGELWTFSLNDTPPPAPPSEKYDLKETSTGVFLPSTLASGDMSQHSLYNGFLCAIRQFVLHGVMATSLFVPFGANSVISLGRILHVDPVLKSNGDLFFKTYYETTGLVRIQRNEDIQMFNPKVFMAPSSVIGEYIEKCSAPANLTQFCQILETTTCVDYTSSTRNYRFKEWIKVKLDDGNVIAWPLELCYWQPATHRKHDQEFGWFNHNDVFGITEDQVLKIKNTHIDEANKAENTNSSKPPPQSAIASINNNNQQEQDHRQNAREPQPQPPNAAPQGPASMIATTSDRAPNANVYPTPPDPQVKRQDENNENWDLTPAGLNNEEWGGLDDGDLFGDGEEITEADFNFFDQPDLDAVDMKDEPGDASSGAAVAAGSNTNGDANVSSSASANVKNDNASANSNGNSKSNDSSGSTVNAKTEAGDDHGDTTKDKSSDAKGKDETSVSTLDFTAETMKPLPESNGKLNGLFAPLKFNPLISKILDSKYTIGGKFYVPEPQSDDEDGDGDGDGDRKMKGFDRCVDSEYSTDDDEPMNEELAAQPEEEKEVEPSTTSDKKETHSLSDWVSVLTANTDTVPDPIESTMEPPTPAGISNYDNYINTMVQQIVWDDGLMTDFLPTVNQSKSPDFTLVKRLSTFFPELEKFTLKNLMDLSDSTASAANATNSIPTVSHIGTPKLESSIDDKTEGMTPKKLDSELGTAALAATTTATTAAAASSVPTTITTAATNDDENAATSTVLAATNVNTTAASTPTASATTAGMNVVSAPASSMNSFAQQMPQPPQIAQMPQMAQMPASLEHQAKKLSSTVFAIEVPSYSMKRAQQVMKAKAPILRFWKVFGLSPKYGSKNTAVVLFAPSGMEQTSATAFVNFLKTTYEGCGLGEMTLIGLQDPGVVPFDCKAGNVDSAMEGLRQAANEFGTTFLEKGEFDNLMVLIATPFHQVATLIPTVSVFAELKDRIQNANSKLNVDLQLVQADKIAAKDTIIMLSQDTMVRLALHIYDKCFVPGFNEELSTEIQRLYPAFTLARMPSKMQLKFNPEPSKSLKDEDMLMHVAYSISNDKRWVSVAWTDQWGEASKIEAINMRRAGSRPRALEQVFAEVWDKTLAIMSRIPVKWRVALAKLGKMTEEECSMWKVLAEGSPQKVNFFYFLTVDISPSLILSGDSNLFPHGKFQRNVKRQKGENGTPITPQRADDSPDMYSINTTPSNQTHADDKGGDNEDSVIVDVMDSTYGVIIRNPMHSAAVNSQHTSQRPPKPIITGYLLKPGNPGEQEQRLMEISLIYCPTSHEGSMRSLLQHYRRLASLGGYTGVAQHTHAMIPWHVEAVDKMQRVLVWVE